MKLKESSKARKFFLTNKGKNARGIVFNGMICGYGKERDYIVLLAADRGGFTKINSSIYIDSEYINYHGGYYTVNLKDIKLL